MTDSPTIHLWGAKGGVGTSTVAAVLALHLARRRPVELRGSTPEQAEDLRALLAMTTTEGPLVLGDHGHDGDGENRVVVIDGGTDHEAPAGALASWLVIRPCYLALRRALIIGARPTGAVMVAEPERSLGQRDIEHVLGVPVVATIPVNTAIARSIDAGLLSARPPRLHLDALVACVGP
jgi:hypothetical protein